MRIPFDSLCLAAVADECQTLIGKRLERIVQPDAQTLCLGFYSGHESFVCVSCDAQFFRAHVMSRWPDADRNQPPFCMSLRKHVGEASLVFVRQRGLDRVLELGLTGAGGDYVLVCELMGKHSNIMLVDSGSKIVAVAKPVGESKSRRPVLVGREYEPPPFDPRPSLLEAADGDDLAAFDGSSPFLRKLIAAGVPLTEVQRTLRDKAWSPTYVEGSGAYPIPVDALISGGVARRSYSQALEQASSQLQERSEREAAVASLRSKLTRVLDARNRALGDIEQALDAAARSREMQEKGELVLAYQSEIEEGSASATLTGYDGEPVTVRLDPEKSAVENAERYFKKAKKAKSGADAVRGQRQRLEEDRAALMSLLQELEGAMDLSTIERLRETADKRKWLHVAGTPQKKEDRPFEGHSIKELLSPGGWRVLYGENATSNDYLTTKVAKPNDLWFHVRGVPSAHVVLMTGNRPERVQTADIQFAARVAVQKSPSKHSSYVSVDYTLKKHVRKPRKSAPGFATYSGEKTVHVEQA